MRDGVLNLKNVATPGAFQETFPSHFQWALWFCGLMSGRPHSPDHEISGNEVAHVLLELPSAGALQEPSTQRLVRTLLPCCGSFNLQRLVLVHRRGDVDAVADLALGYMSRAAATACSRG